MRVEGAPRGLARRLLYRVQDQRVGRRYDVVVSDRLGAIYFRVPKVANTSIRRALQQHLPWGFRETRVSAGELRENYEGYFRFGFVRDPRSRVVSAYLNKLCFKHPHKVDYFFWQYPALHYGIPFNEFVDFLSSQNGSDRYADRHWLSQRYFFPRSENKKAPEIDWIGRYENLVEDWNLIGDRLGIHVPLSHDKPHESMVAKWDKGHGKNYHLQFYDAETMGKVEKRYREDMEEFGY